MPAVVNTLFGAVLRAWIAITSWLPAAASLAVLSAVIGIAMLPVFRWASNQQAIQKAKDRVQAHLMEMRLFPDEPGTTIRAFGSLLWWNSRYFFSSMRPAAVLAIPMIPFLIQLDHYYGHRPLEVGETALVTVKAHDLATRQPELQAPEGIVVESPPARSMAENLASWRIRAAEPGDWTVSVKLDDTVTEKSVHVGDAPVRLSNRRVRSAWSSILHPVEKRIPPDGPEWIEVRYPATELPVGPTDLHWITILLIVSIIVAFTLRKRFGVVL